jgi:hypothetical protein
MANRLRPVPRIALSQPKRLRRKFIRSPLKETICTGELDLILSSHSPHPPPPTLSRLPCSFLSFSPPLFHLPCSFLSFSLSPGPEPPTRLRVLGVQPADNTKRTAQPALGLSQQPASTRCGTSLTTSKHLPRTTPTTTSKSTISPFCSSCSPAV